MEINNNGTVRLSREYHPEWDTIPCCNTTALANTRNRITIFPVEILV
jgi:hypothetical protein